MLTWSRNESRVLAIWHFAHAWQLDDTDTWIIEITPDGITCNRPSLDNREAEQVGRELMIQSWRMQQVWHGQITVKRHADTYDPDWRPT
ncbi:hypothetical protein KIH74_22830 [Kineosporia sp. J2-2]|uniref:DUF2188 domain-containing protein n=1 Tax=Kineosporia corallincola TaxID=2835133 RepID=A0ABS5TN31_9ACTN|nr:hypothetical protein [Kineosporia corallincola]MBT0771794.1 hypothetical protein [Kineosporia corallincola]